MRNDPTGHDWEDCGERGGYRCQIHKKNVRKVLKEGGYYDKKTSSSGSSTPAQNTPIACTTLACETGNIGGNAFSHIPSATNGPGIPSSSGPANFSVSSGSGFVSNQDYSEPELVAIGLWAKYGKMLLEGMVLVENYGVPAYKHIRGLGSLGGPAVEGAIGFTLQIASDWNDPSLSAPQKFWNASVIGAESALTDALSAPIAASMAAPIGAAAGTALCGPGCGIAGGGIAYAAGFTMSSVLINEVVTGLIWDPLNKKIMYGQ